MATRVLLLSSDCVPDILPPAALIAALLMI